LVLRQVSEPILLNNAHSPVIDKRHGRRRIGFDIQNRPYVRYTVKVIIASEGGGEQGRREREKKKEGKKTEKKSRK
jgi:hypothetical protein